MSLLPFFFMPIVTLIRHGQAGTRDDYDVLSEIGDRQARLLGDWLKARSPRFDAVLSGELQRQRQTAALAFDGAAADIQVDPGWNEFDLDTVFDAYVPRLAEADPGFGVRYGALQEEIARGGTAIHREWRPADSEVVIAWVMGRFGEIDGVESWQAFRERVKGALRSLDGMKDNARVVVFTSALPTGIVVAEALGLDPGWVLRLAATTHNTGITVIRMANGKVDLVSFNATGHLGHELLTHR